ncbi:hypothetical protein F4818DRAFT_280175 [Hypoxylon cercidicola]|nr:hypothetical protein F4818DRAFT_280175 [Hypoxylon cercidicola]
MSVDIRELSDANVDRLTRLLSRRPEYGIARPSRRWLQRQEVKLKSFPSEMLRTSSLLKRLIIKLADNISPSAIDPRAVLCKVHSVLNPWLIRRLFLAVAYEVTVHSDTIRSWKGRMDYPALSAFVGRVDAIAALWTEPELYRQCYGIPPFENHMVFVKSDCEACILGAVGANARVLADLRAILVDRVERRPPRPDGRPGSEPRLTRYVNNWISYLQEERAAKCIDRSDSVLEELRNARPQLMQWRNRRRKEQKGSRASDIPIYTELRRTNDGHRLTTVPNDAYRVRRTRDGIPVAMTIFEEAEEQRRTAMYGLQDAESIFRPDSINPLSEAALPRTFRYNVPNQQEPATPGTSYDVDPYFDYFDYGDYEEMDGNEEQELERALGQDEDGRSHVGDWYAGRLATSRADLTEDDAQSMLSTVHPAFQPQRFTHGSAVPNALGIYRNWNRSTGANRHANRTSVWTDVTAHTDDTNPTSPNAGEVPPIPRVPSEYRRRSTRPDHNGETTPTTPHPASRASRARPTRPTRPRQNSAPSVAASSVYSDQLSPRSPRSEATSPRERGPPPAFLNSHARRYLYAGSSSAGTSRSSSRQTNPNPNTTSNSNHSNHSNHSNPNSRLSSYRGPVRSYAAEDYNPYGRAAPRSEGVPSMTTSMTSRSESGYDVDTDTDADADDGPPTPRARASTSMSVSINQDSVWRQLEDELGDITPWSSFYRRPEADK